MNIIGFLLGKMFVIEWGRSKVRLLPLVGIKFMGITIAEKIWNPLGNLWENNKK